MNFGHRRNGFAKWRRSSSNSIPIIWWRKATLPIRTIRASISFRTICTRAIPVAMIEQIHRSIQRAAGHNKVYWVGEFGFVTTEGMRDIIDTVIHEPGAAGALIWSLRFHDNDGGYYWHHEPHGGDFFKAYHWPGGPMGEPYDEIRFMKMVRDKAYEIQNQTPPALKRPEPPELIEVTDGGIVNWRGSAGAESYDLRRVDKPNTDGLGIRWHIT